MKTSQIRNILANALEKAAAGELSQHDAKSLVGLSNQITQSIAVEIKAVEMQLKLGQKVAKFGDFKVNE